MKKKKFKIALAQIKIEQKNIEENCKKIFKKIEEAAKENIDIICFPELATIGYTITTDELQNLPEDFNNTFIEKLQEKAKLFKIHILVGYLESEINETSGVFYNSCIFIDDEGEILANARKVYLWKKEKTKFKAGDKFIVKDTKFGKIGILLCYDLEFPEPARIECLKGAEIIFVPSLWSFSAENRWHIDLAANSLFNLLFIAGCNAVGDSCCGKSKIIEPNGITLIEASGTKEELLLATIDLAKLDEIRNKIPYLSDFKSDTFSDCIINGVDGRNFH
ncbi:nitrilase [Fusobacterium polymorphum]|uniref:Nitrilase n=1 Tax=Fusobacterium nucleatum subsp. polymorphum TaxID=76857 RepID=A0A2B7YMX8_FUSNP|nr:nitrilase-related carbon-nitrogen hydrolase [Fusobacterium polymorphum]PGH22363.1 nitrilase [Fusobacterium polymorphum]